MLTAMSDLHCIAVGAALAWEIEAVLVALQQCGAVQPIRRRHWQATVGSVRIVVYRTGVGVSAARRATRRVLRETPAALVLNTGCAGALVSDWSPGDLIGGTIIAGPPPLCSLWPTDVRAREMICEVAATNGLRVRCAPLVTTVAPLINAAQKRACALASRADAVDMEGAGVAEAAAEQGRTFASLRAILDPLRPDLPSLALLAARRRDPWQVARSLASPVELLRTAALYRGKRSARASLRRFCYALFSAVQRGQIDPYLEGLR